MTPQLSLPPSLSFWEKKNRSTSVISLAIERIQNDDKWRITMKEANKKKLRNLIK